MPQSWAAPARGRDASSEAAQTLQEELEKLEYQAQEREEVLKARVSMAPEVKIISLAGPGKPSVADRAVPRRSVTSHAEVMYKAASNPIVEPHPPTPSRAQRGSVRLRSLLKVHSKSRQVAKGRECLLG